MSPPQAFQGVSLRNKPVEESFSRLPLGASGSKNRPGRGASMNRLQQSTFYLMAFMADQV